MNITVFNKTILLKKMAQTSRGGFEQVSSRYCRASLRLPTTGFAVRAEAAGRRVDMIAVVRRRDFEADHYTHIEFDGIAYRISRAEADMKDMFVRLSLERG